MIPSGFRFHPSAFDEIDEAREWYDAQSPGLGFEFVDAIDDAIALIVELPDAWPRDSAVSNRVLRKYVMHRFPYSVIYDVADDTVRVLAIAHAKRKPGYWRTRTRDAF